MKTIWFDMDGTLFDLYGKPNWLELLRAENPEAYAGDHRLFNNDFYSCIEELIQAGWDFGVITWGSKESSLNFLEETEKVKRNWCKRFLPFIKNFYCVPYGTPKHIVPEKKTKTMILIDDNAEVCKSWETRKQRRAILVNQYYNVVNALSDLLEGEI